MARGFIADFLVRVTSKDLGKTQKQVESLAATVDRVAEANSRATKGHQNLNSTMEKGIIGTANGTKSFSKLAETIGGGSRVSLVGVYATLAANVFAVSAAFNALRSAAQVQQILAGLDAAGTRVGLTLSVTTRRVQELAGGMLTAEQAARSTAQFMAGGFKTDTLERFTTLSRDVSIALGRNMTDSMDRLTRGVLKLEPELLDELGIMTKLGDATTAYAIKIHKPVAALTQFERRQAFSNAVLAEGELKFKGLSAAAGDTTVYDRLSATFANLTKDVFGFINKGIAPLIGGLADSKLALVGMITLFASSIKSQLLPMFNDMGAKSQLLAQSLAKNALGGTGFLSETLKSEDSEIQTWVGQVEEGTAKYDHFKDTHSYVTNSIIHNEEMLADTTVKMTKKKRAELTAYTEHLKDVEKQVRSYGVSTLTSTAHSTSSNAINLASQGNFSEAMKERRASIASFNGAMELSNGGITKWNKTLFTATTSLRMFGAAFLYALPYIGLFIAGVALLDSWINKVSPAQKKLNDAYTDFGEILAVTSKKNAEYQRINESEASYASRNLATMILRGQAINELTNAYDKLNVAKIEADKAAIAENMKEQAHDARVAALDAEVSGNYKLATSIRQTQLALENRIKVGKELDVNANSWVIDIFKGSTIDKGVAQLTQGLIDLDREGVQKLLNSYGALDSKQQGVTMSGERWRTTIEAVAKELRDNNNAAQLATQAVTDNFKALDDAVAKFSLSQQQSTPYDDMVKGLNGAVTAVDRLEILLLRGKISAENYNASLSSIGQNSLTILSPNVQSDSKLLAEIDAQTQAEKLRAKSLKDADQIERTNQNIYKFETARAIVGRTLSLGLKAQLIEEQNIARVAQEQARNLDSQIKKLQGMRATYGDIYQQNGEGLLEQYAQEDKIRALQVEKLKNEAHHHERLIATAEAQIKALRTSKEDTLQLAQKEVIANRILGIENLRNQALKFRIKMNAGGIVSQRELDDLESRSRILSDDRKIAEEARSKALAANKEIDISIQEQNSSIAANRDALKGLNADIEAILAQSPSLDQRTAAAMKRDYELSQEYLKAYKEISQIQKNMVGIQDRLRGYAEGTTGSLSTQIAQMKVENRFNIDNLLLDQKNDRRRIEVERAVKKANVDRARAAGDSSKAGELLLEQSDKDLHNSEVLVENKVKEILYAERLQMIETATFDTRKEGLGWQREMLSYREKEVELQAQLSKATLETFHAKERTALIQADIPQSENFNKAQALEARVEAYRLAVSETNLREQAIDLEYALLDAQREMMLWELKERRAILKEAEVPDDNPHMQQLVAIISGLEKSPVGKQLADIEKRTRRQGLETERQGIIQDSTKGNNLSQQFNSLRSEVIGMSRLNAARAVAQAADSFESRKTGAVTVIDTKNNALGNTIPEIDKKMAGQLQVAISAKTHIANIDENVQRLADNAGLGTSSVAVNAGAITGSPTQQAALIEAARQIGTSAKDLATVISYETGGTFSPSKRGGSDNKYIGTIQFGPSEQKQFGATINQTFEEQMVSVVKFFKARNFKPGMSILDLYSTINAGSPGHYNASDGYGTVKSHTDKAVREHSGNADKFLSGAAVTTPPAPSATATLPPVQPSLSDTEIADIYTNADHAAEKFGQRIVKMAGETGKPIEDIIESFVRVGTTIQALPEPPDYGKMFPLTLGDKLSVLKDQVAEFAEGLKKLGPQGEIVAAIGNGIMDIATKGEEAFKILADSSKSSTEQFQAGLAVVSSVLSAVSSITQASSDAKVANIDREIAAEQKRDGKSAASLAKIDSLEKKKDSIARKSFNMQKKLMMAQAVIATASGIAQAAARVELFPFNFVLAGMIGAMGLAQLAIIAGTSYQSTASSSSTGAAMPSAVNIGKQGDTIDLAKNNQSPGGEIGYLRGAQGQGTNSSNYRVIPSAYGGRMPRGYGNTAFAIGEHGPEILTPDNPISARPIGNDNHPMAGAQAVHFNIQALDAKGVEEILYGQRGNIIGMLREASNANGKPFMEEVNTSVYTNPRTSRL